MRAFSYGILALVEAFDLDIKLLPQHTEYILPRNSGDPADDLEARGGGL